MNILSIAIDMGAKNNGVFIVKSENDKILDKKATNIIVDKINFSKKSRRENRHKDRNYKRRKLAKRLQREIIDFSLYTLKEQELIQGLLNNRGYTFISTSTEFEKLNDETIKFIDKHFEELKNLNTKEDFENKISDFENLEDLKSYINSVNEKINLETKKKKEEFYKEFQDSFSTIIKKDLQTLRDLFSNILKEIETGSKPRKKYLDEISKEIQSDFDFIKEFSKEEFFNLIGNISNLQLRVLRKYFNQKFDDKLDKVKLNIKIRKYFKAFHYKSDKKKIQRKELFEILEKEPNILNFLKNTNPQLTIPPYEDMNNRNTYKCNTMHIKPEIIDENLKSSIDTLLNNQYFSHLKIDIKGELNIEELIKVYPSKNDVYTNKDFTYSKYLQRIFDIKVDEDNKAYYPRNVFKQNNPDAIKTFKRLFGDKVYEDLKTIASKFYIEEEKILNGIYEESTSIFTKCNTNTTYKRNVKHILLKPIYSYNFTVDEANEFSKAIENTYGLKTALERISNEAKKYQNSFYHIVEACYKNDKCIDDKDIKNIVKNLDKNFIDLKAILKNKDTYINTIEKIDETNLSRVVNILKQTYEILFKELGGFNKTCKNCTIENSIRSDENNVIAKRLLSDVAKPIDGMLDMMLDRLAYEITENIEDKDIENISSLEIVLEQNKFEFEDGLREIKNKTRLNQKELEKRESFDKLNKNICPYTGNSFTKGDWDHILPQSKGVFNSKANMIYASVEGNQKVKGNKEWSLEDIFNNAFKHLEEVFGKKTLDEIREIIKQGINSINKDNFTNFNNLKLNQQIALRYALFMRNTDEFRKAFEIIKKDKIKTFSNGTQKRLARFIYEKLVKKFPNKFENIEVQSKVIDNQLVSNTRKYLSVNQETGEINHLFKEEKQNSHSHCIDAMVVFYLANSKVSGQKHRQKENVSSMVPIFDFDDIYLDESGINNLSKNKTFINSPKKELGSYKLFDETIYSEHYKHITKDTLKQNELEILIGHNLLYVFENGKKKFISKIDEIEDKVIYKLDIQKVSNKVYELFLDKNQVELSKLKFIDKLQYFTSRKEIETIFINDKKTALKKFNEIKNIPHFSTNLYKAVYKKLENESNLFFKSEDGKTSLNNKSLENLSKELFESKQKNQNKEQRKRAKKRHKFTLPILGSPKFRIKRANNTWQVLGNKDIATKNYIINGNIKPIAYFSKNTIPVKISDLIDCLLINENTPSIYEVEIDNSEINKFVKNLTYFVSEAKRCTVQVTFMKSSFKDVEFSNIETFDGAKDEIFKYFLENYIENKELELNKYLGSIRDGLKGKATLQNNTNETLTIEYKAAITSDKKRLILNNIKTK